MSLRPNVRRPCFADAPAAFSTTLAEAQARRNEFWQGQADDHLGNRPCATWIAVDTTGQGVGTLAGVEQTEAIDVIQVWVAAECRGSGLVDELFDALFVWAPHDRIDIAVAKSNGRARAAYERLGFHSVGERPGAQETEVEMTQQHQSTRS